MENLQLLDNKLAYSVKKLIAINSICYCYTELPIDQHCALFGRNNLGKTSLLNALKLHLFPEISFNDCKAKFAFKSSKGDLYSIEDSYQFYFPTDSSFLILEAENIHGAFCLILFRSNSSFGYERLALPCAYDEIRKHFWDIDNLEVNNGLGSPVSDLGSLKKDALYELYKAKGAVFLKTTKEIKEKLFTHAPLVRTKGRYCLVPLKEAGVERELRAFRQLMNFTFEIAKTDTKGLTETFATIIESDKINAQDRLHQDVQKILDDYKQLREAQNKLTAIKNYRDHYQQLTQTQQLRIERLAGYAKDHQIAAFNLNRIYQEQQEKHKQLEPEANKLEIEEQWLARLGSDLRTENGKLSGRFDLLNENIKKLDQKKKQSYERISREYANCSNDEIKNHLKAHKEKLEESLRILKDKELTIDTLDSKIRERNRKINERDKKKQAIEQQEKLLLSKTDPHTSSVLSKLNDNFSTFIACPSEVQLSILNQFDSLFKFAPDRLEFLGELFIDGDLKSPQDLRARLGQEIINLNEEITKLDGDIQKLNQIAKSTNQQIDIELNKTEKDLNKAKNDLEPVHDL